MNEKPKRPWFRFHLLTLVLMMLAAGGFIGANLLVPQWHFRKIASKDEIFWIMRHLNIYGWPCAIYSYDWAEVDATDVHFFVSGFRDWTPHWRAQGIALDCGFLILILNATAFLSESILRRREAHKQ